MHSLKPGRAAWGQAYIARTGDYAVDANWLDNFGVEGVPPVNDTPWINNGGTVNADGATSGSGGTP